MRVSSAKLFSHDSAQEYNRGSQIYAASKVGLDNQIFIEIINISLFGTLGKIR